MSSQLSTLIECERFARFSRNSSSQRQNLGFTEPSLPFELCAGDVDEEKFDESERVRVLESIMDSFRHDL